MSLFFRRHGTVSVVDDPCVVLDCIFVTVVGFNDLCEQLVGDNNYCLNDLGFEIVMSSFSEIINLMRMILYNNCTTN